MVRRAPCFDMSRPAPARRLKSSKRVTRPFLSHLSSSPTTGPNIVNSRGGTLHKSTSKQQSYEAARRACLPLYTTSSRARLVLATMYEFQ
ncbi:hypothetical protein E2C01_024230 [Portunus trituberculatus]|uniref:Uncharacterized protein n=1 Tax=Portunus trituberculatus TaxID=210409 RepID=A0A5B7EBP8_PORTR|nr:hypothetical protein [Portunus trituberculatus]